MSKINVQYHAVPDETIKFIKECAKEYNLHIVMVELYPSFAAYLFDEVGDALGDTSYCYTNRVCLYINKPDIGTNSYMDFLDKNPDYLLITIGKLLDNQLEESVLATQTENAESLKVWKKIVKKLNSITSSGAWVVNPINGAKVFYKKHRYTNGAKKLFIDGVKVVPLVGWNYYILDEVALSNN
jgi:hypothetical protein